MEVSAIRSRLLEVDLLRDPLVLIILHGCACVRACVCVCPKLCCSWCKIRFPTTPTLGLQAFYLPGSYSLWHLSELNPKPILGQHSPLNIGAKPRELGHPPKPPPASK